MGPKTTKLIRTLEEIVELLESDEQTHWSEYMSTARQLLLTADYAGVEHLLRAYGGMGSFNDLILGQEMIDGRFKWKPDSEVMNEQLSRLSSKAFELASYIKRNHEFE